MKFSSAGRLRRPGRAGAAAAAAATLLTTSVFVAVDAVQLPTELARPVVAASEGMTRGAAIAFAVANSPVLKAAKEAVEMARGDYVHYSAANNLQAFVGVSTTPNVRDVDPPNINDVPNRDLSYFQYVFPTSGRRHWSTLSARGRFDAAVATFKTAELDLLQAVKFAYSDLQQSQGAVSVNEQTWKIAHTFTELARRQYTAGGVPFTNVISAEVTEGQAEQALINAHFDVQVKEKALLAQLGDRSHRRVEATDPLGDSPIIGQLDEFQATALYRRPEVTAAMAIQRGLTAQVGVAKADRRPDLTVQAVPTGDSSNTGTPPLRAFVQLPLFDRGLIGGNVIQARAAAQQAQHNLEQERVQVSLEVATAFRQVQSSQGVLNEEVRRILPNSRTLLDKSRLSYMSGAATILDILYAQQTYRNENLNYVAALAGLARNIAALERATAAPVVVSPTHPFHYDPRAEAPAAATPSPSPEPASEQ
jgi:outer membrane protein TolC